MPNWKHTIRIKDLLKHDAEDHDQTACEIGPVAAQRVKDLANKLTSREPFLSADLEEVAEALADVENEESPQEAFNDALANLYDIGDLHSIWVG